MPTPTTDAQNNALPRRPDGQGAVKPSALSVAALEDFVRTHLSEAKDMPLDQLAGTSVETLVRESIEGQKREEATSPYNINSAAAQKQAADDKAAKEEEQREYEQRLLTGEQLAQFNEMVEQTDQTLSQNDDKMKQIDAALTQKRQDLESREIVIGNGSNQRHVLVGPNSTFVDAKTNKTLTDPKDIAAAKAQEKPDSATVAENQKLLKQEQRRDQLAANENSLNQQQKTIKTSPPTNGNADSEKKVNKGAQDQAKNESSLVSQLQSQSSVYADYRQSINPVAPSAAPTTQTPSAPQSSVAATENKSVQTFSDTNKEKQDTKDSRWNKMIQSSSTTSDSTQSIHSVFANYKANNAGNQSNTTPTTRTTSFASSQPDLATDNNAKLQKSGATIQPAFTSAAQANMPATSSNAPSLANNGPSLTQNLNKKPAAPAMA